MAQTYLSLFTLIILASITGVLYVASGEFIFFVLLIIPLSFFLFILSLFVGFFYPKRVKIIKLSFISFLICLGLLGLFLSLVKLQFFDSAIFFVFNHTQNCPVILEGNPSGVYLVIQNWDFWGVQKNSLFILDFSRDTELSPFAVQLIQFEKTKPLFHYVFQLLCLDSSWFPVHFNLVFV
jgi:hypothetical protein